MPISRNPAKARKRRPSQREPQNKTAAAGRFPSFALQLQSRFPAGPNRSHGPTGRDPDRFCGENHRRGNSSHNELAEELRKLVCYHKSYLRTTNFTAVCSALVGTKLPCLLRCWDLEQAGNQSRPSSSRQPRRLISLFLQTSRVRARALNIRGRCSWMQCDCNRNLPREECSEQLAIQDLQLQLPSRQSSCPRGNVVASRQSTCYLQRKDQSEPGDGDLALHNTSTCSISRGQSVRCIEAETKHDQKEPAIEFRKLARDA